MARFISEDNTESESGFISKMFNDQGLPSLKDRRMYCCINILLQSSQGLRSIFNTHKKKKKNRMYKQIFLIDNFRICHYQSHLEKFNFHGRYLRYFLPFALELTEPVN